MDTIDAMRDSVMSITIYSGKVDAKLCLEVGAAVLLDKPIILVVLPGTKIAENLGKLATRIIQGDPKCDPQVYKEVQDAISHVIGRRTQNSH